MFSALALIINMQLIKMKRRKPKAHGVPEERCRNIGVIIKAHQREEIQMKFQSKVRRRFSAATPAAVHTPESKVPVQASRPYSAPCRAHRTRVRSEAAESPWKQRRASAGGADFSGDSIY